MAAEALATSAPVLTGCSDVATSWLDWLGVAFSSTPHRFRHVQMVWQRAVGLRRLELRWLDPSRANRLELAALLHDVGRALDPGDTEPHGFVGARLLDAVGLSDVAPLVAHHSGARHEANARGMAHLDRWSVDEPDLLAVLTFLDRTTSASGERVSLSQRRSDLSDRYGASSLPVRVFDATLPEIRHAARLLRTSNGSHCAHRRSASGTRRAAEADLCLCRQCCDVSTVEGVGIGRRRRRPSP